MVKTENIKKTELDGAAAKATSSDKTVAPIAVYTSPDRTHGEETMNEFKMVTNDIGVYESRIIAEGSNGTVIYEGSFGLRVVAVKRIVKAHFDLYQKEIEILDVVDRHLNIVTLFGHEETSDFVYVVLQLCDCSLYKFVRGDEAYAKMFSQNGYPSSDLLNLMRGIVNGVAYLHAEKVIHGNLNPHKVLICKKLCPKLFGMGRRLAADKPNDIGWRAPEQIRNPNNTTEAMDMFNLGCVLFFCLTQGEHPFGDDGRDTNVASVQKVNIHLVEHISEAVDLFNMLLHPNPVCRPKALDVLLHPLFWNSRTRMWFLRDARRRLESEDEKVSSIVRSLENQGGSVFLEKWDNKIDHAFLLQMIKNTEREYRYDKVQDLLLIIEDIVWYYDALPKNIQVLLGSFPEGVEDYFRHKFPKLLMVVYSVAHVYCKEEGWFRATYQTLAYDQSFINKWLQEIGLNKGKKQVSGLGVIN